MDLLGIEKAAVPVTVVSTDVLAQEVKELPLLKEFVLRLLQASVGGAAEISAFLGLDRKLVDIAVADLYRDGELVFGPGLGQLLLTDRGRKTADAAKAVRPAQKTLKLAFDRLTWTVTDYEIRDLLTKSAALAEGCVLLPAERTTRIKTADIPPAAVNAILRQPSGAAAIEVLDVVDVNPSTHRYLPVHLLVYGDQDRGEIETAVIVDGDPSGAHDAALGKLGGSAKLGLRIAPAGRHAPLPRHLEDERIQPTSEVLFDEHPPRVCGIERFQHQLALMIALDSARNRLLIVTDVATRSVVDGAFISKLEGRLRARVAVDLVLARPDKLAERELTSMARWSKGKLKLHRSKATDVNTLIFDDKWVVSDFPWLSYRGTDQTFRDYSGTLVTIPAETEHEYRRLLSAFTTNPVNTNPHAARGPA